MSGNRFIVGEDFIPVSSGANSSRLFIRNQSALPMYLQDSPSGVRDGALVLYPYDMVFWDKDTPLFIAGETAQFDSIAAVVQRSPQFVYVGQVSDDYIPASRITTPDRGNANINPVINADKWASPVTQKRYKFLNTSGARYARVTVQLDFLFFQQTDFNKNVYDTTCQMTITGGVYNVDTASNQWTSILGITETVQRGHKRVFTFPVDGNGIDLLFTVNRDSNTSYNYGYAPIVSIELLNEINAIDRPNYWLRTSGTLDYEYRYLPFPAEQWAWFTYPANPSFTAPYRSVMHTIQNRVCTMKIALNIQIKDTVAPGRVVAIKLLSLNGNVLWTANVTSAAAPTPTTFTFTLQPLAVGMYFLIESVKTEQIDADYTLTESTAL